MATTGQDGGGTVYIRPVVSADGVAAGVADIKQEFASIPVAAQQAAQSTSKSLASLGVPAEATANIERFKDAFGGIARATKEELGESARFTNSYVSQLRRTAADVDSVTQAMVNKARTLQSADPRLQNDTVNQTIAGLQKLATQNEAVTAAVKQQAAAQQVANKAASEAAIQFGNFERSAAAARLELLSFGKTASEKYQIRAELLGIDKTQAVQKIVTDLKAAEAAALAAGKGVGAGLQQPMERLGMTAKQTTAALRQVPAQFTDIIVSLQGGQAPLTVLLQQGGQLKDVFGGVGNAAKAMGGYVLGLVNPFTLAAAAVVGVAAAYYAGSQEADAFRKALVFSGNQVGLTTGGLADMAKNMGAVSGTTGAAASALATFAASGAVGAAGIQKATEAAIALEKYGGQAVAETVKQFKSLGDDPLKASIRLNDAANFLTTSLYEQIKALEEQGRTIEAADLAQNAFADALSDRANEMKTNLGSIEIFWLGVKSAILEAVDAAKNINRPETTGQKIAKTQAAINEYSNNSKGGLNGFEKIRLGALQQELETLNRIALKEQDRATNAAQQALEMENRIAADKIRETLLSKSAKMEREIAQTRATLVRDGADRLEIEKAILAIREKYKEKASKPTGISEAAREVEKGLRVYNDLIAKSTDLNADFEEKWNGLSAAYRGRKIDLDQLTAAQKELLSEQRFSKEADKALADQSAASAKAVADLSRDYDAYVKKLDSAASAAVKQVQALEDEEKALVIAAEQNISLAQAIEQVTIARLKKAQTKAYAKGDQEAGDAIKREIEARKKLATAIGGKEVREANKKAADDAAKEWQKGWEETDRLARDVFVTWAEDGSNAAKKIGDTLKKALLSAIYEATIKPVAFQIYSSATSALGLPGSGGGAGGLLDSASNAYSLYNKASSLFGGSTSSAFGFAGLAGAGTAAGASAALPAITATAIEAGITAGGASIYALGSAAGAAGATIPVLGGTLGAGGLVASAPVVAAPLAAAPAAAAIPGIGWAIGGALLLAGMMGSDNGPKLASTGDAIRRYDKGGALTENATNGAWFFTNTDDANKLLDGLESRYQKAAKALGIGTVATQFDYGSNNRGNFALAGAAGNSRANTGEIAYSAEAMQVAASRAVFAALQGSELPKYLSGLLDSVGDINALSQAQIDDVLNTAQAFKGLHDVMVQMPFEALHDLSYNAAKGLVEFSGGLDKLTQNLGTYYDNFYSAEEKKAQTLANITRTLTDAGALTRTTRTAIAGEFDVRVGAQGDTSLEQRYATSVENLDMPKTREEFRALAESLQDLGGEAAQKAYAALMSVSGAFASVTPAAADAAAALEKDLAARATWQQKLDVLTGKTTEQQIERANDLAGVTNEATAALIKQVHAQQDIAMSATKAADAMKAVTAANASIQGSKTQIYNVENDIAPERAALTAAQEAWAGAIKEIKDIAVNSFGLSQSDVDKWGAAEIEGFKVEDFADSEFFDSVQQALTDYWADKATLIAANDSFAEAEAAAKSSIDTHHDGLAKGNQIRDDELSLKARLYELTGDAEKLAEVVKEQRGIIASGLSTTQADLQWQIWAEEDKTAGGAGKDILAERNSLQAELNALTDTAAQALARQRDALDESNRALFDNIHATKAAKAIADQRTELESRLAIATGASTALEISRKKELAAALDSSNRSMLKAIYAAEDLTLANEKAAVSAKEAATAASQNANQALAGVQRAVDAQKKLAQVQVDVAQESVSNLSSIFNSLRANVAQLYGSVESTTRQSAAQGNNFIAQALATAKSTGYFPDADDLADAVAAAMQGVDGNVYKSQADADFAKLSLAGSLSGLKDLSKTGLTTAEKALKTAEDQLTVLDQTLETARAQLDAVNGVNTSVLSVADALAAFSTSIADLVTANALADSTAIRATDTPVAPATTRILTPDVVPTAHKGTIYEATTGLTALYGAAYLNTLGSSLDDLYAAARAAHLPGFASGINRVPYDMQAIIHKDEAVVPAAFNPFNPNAQQGSAGNARLEALVEGLTAEVQRLQAIVNDGNKQTRRTADAVNGNPEMPMLVETV